MKILFVLEYFYPHLGGVETLFKGLTEKLVEEGHSVTVVTNKFEKSLKKNETLKGVEIIRLPLHSRYIFTALASIPVFVKAKDYDFIHTTSYNAAIPAIIAGILRKKKVIITFHEVWGKLWFDLPFMGNIARWGHYLFEQMLLKFPFHKFIAVSEYTKNSLIENGINPKAITRIYNGLHYSKREIRPKDIRKSEKYSFLFIGRLGISKGIDLLLGAANLFYSKYKYLNLTMVIPKNPKSFRKKVDDLIVKYGLQNHIKILSNLSNEQLNSEIQLCDCMVIPSYSEGFGFVAADAVANGKDIVHSNRGSLSEVVGGRQIAMENMDAESLMRAMEKAQLGDFEVKPVLKFELHDTVQQHIDLYETLTVNQ